MRNQSKYLLLIAALLAVYYVLCGFYLNHLGYYRQAKGDGAYRAHPAVLFFVYLFVHQFCAAAGNCVGYLHGHPFLPDGQHTDQAL